jgi:hypothetical protein
MSTMVELVRALNRYLKGVLNRAKRPGSGLYNRAQREIHNRRTRSTLVRESRLLTKRLAPATGFIADRYTAHDEIGLGGSDPLHYVWAALSPKMAGRSRPNRVFRPRSILSLRLANRSDGAAFRSARGRTQGPNFQQNTACNLAF